LGRDIPQLRPVTQLEDSDLDVYSPKNPFAPLAQLKAPAALAVSRATATATAPAAGAGTTSGGDVPVSPVGGGTVPRFITPRSTPDAQPTLYTYVVDLDFGPSGSERPRNGVARLRILPHEEKPLLVFLGVTADNRRAVFLADSTASQRGEGRCEPDPDNCSLVYLTTGKRSNEHYVTDSAGQEYLLRLREIRRVEVDALKEREARRRKADRQEAKTSESSSGTTGRAGLERLFGFLLFTDEEQ